MNNLQNRLVDFSVSILTLTECLNKSVLLKPLFAQLIRSATSIGANYSEAQSTGYPKDFHHKIRIALKEARETEYWLVVINKKIGNNESIVQAKKEVLEIIKILTVICMKTKPKYKN